MEREQRNASIIGYQISFDHLQQFMNNQDQFALQLGILSRMVHGYYNAHRGMKYYQSIRNVNRYLRKYVHLNIENQLAATLNLIRLYLSAPCKHRITTVTESVEDMSQLLFEAFNILTEAKNQCMNTVMFSNCLPTKERSNPKYAIVLTPEIENESRPTAHAASNTAVDVGEIISRDLFIIHKNEEDKTKKESIRTKNFKKLPNGTEESSDENENLDEKHYDKIIADLKTRLRETKNLKKRPKNIKKKENKIKNKGITKKKKKSFKKKEKK